MLIQYFIIINRIRTFFSYGNGFLSGKYSSKDNFDWNSLTTVITRLKKKIWYKSTFIRSYYYISKRKI